MKELLKFLSTIYLIASIIFAVWFVWDSGSIETTDYWGEVEKTANPIAYVIGIGIAFQGLLTFAMAQGICIIIDKSDILLNMTDAVLKKSLEFDKVQYKKCPNCGQLNSVYSSSCENCNNSLMDAEIVKD